MEDGLVIAAGAFWYTWGPLVLSLLAVGAGLGLWLSVARGKRLGTERHARRVRVLLLVVAAAAFVAGWVLRASDPVAWARARSEDSVTSYCRYLRQDGGAYRAQAEKKLRRAARAELAEAPARGLRRAVLEAAADAAYCGRSLHLQLDPPGLEDPPPNPSVYLPDYGFTLRYEVRNGKRLSSLEFEVGRVLQEAARAYELKAVQGALPGPPYEDWLLRAKVRVDQGENYVVTWVGGSSGSSYVRTIKLAVTLSLYRPGALEPVAREVVIANAPPDKPNWQGRKTPEDVVDDIVVHSFCQGLSRFLGSTSKAGR